jgi:DNA-binding response OmpR family regulator
MPRYDFHRWSGACLHRPESPLGSLFEVLLRNAGKVVTRDQLAQAALGRDLAPFDRGVDVHLSKLRKKLGGGQYSQDRIQTVRGSGCIYVALEQKADLW